MEDAKQVVVTPLLPVKGLRRDVSGNLVDDSIKTVLEGLKALGVRQDAFDLRDATMIESRRVLCTLNAQYQFLLDDFLTKVVRNQPVGADDIAALRTKNVQMQDVLSISRYVLSSAAAEKTKKEGFQVWRGAELKESSRLFEAFQQATQTLMDDQQALEAQNYMALRRRALEDSEEKTRYANRQLALYAFLNITALGLLFYIASL